MKFKTIIYDFDGVICDSVNVKTEAFAKLYETYGDEIKDKVIQYHLANGGISRFEKFKYFQKVYIRKDLSENDIALLSEEFSKLVKQKVIDAPYLKGALNFLMSNKNKYKQYICTGTPENEIVEITDKKEISIFFNGIYGSPKTKVEIIKNILLKENLNSNEVVFFGDALTDLRASKETDIFFIGVRNSETFFPEGTFTINDFSDTKLLGIL